MEKIYLKNGKEVQLGDTICRTEEKNHPLFGKCKATVYIPITKITYIT